MLLYAVDYVRKIGIPEVVMGLKMRVAIVYGLVKTFVQ